MALARGKTFGVIRLLPGRKAYPVESNLIMANYYYLNEDRKTVGPVSLEQLRDLGHQGVIRAETFVAMEGDPQWRPYAEAIAATPLPPVAGDVPPTVPPVAPPPGISLQKPASSTVVPLPILPAPVPVAARKSRLGTWIALGCAGLFALLLIAVAGIVLFVFGVLRSTEPATTSVSRAKNNPQAVQLLGEPIEAGWFVSGSVSTHRDALGDETGLAKLSVPVKGPRASGTVRLEGERQSGRWLYSLMELQSGGKTVDLLDEKEKAAPQ
jgi:hypothetical protein